MLAVMPGCSALVRRESTRAAYIAFVVIPLPPKPEPPDPRDCCGSGCVRCIFDLYEDELERWRAAVSGSSAERPDEEAKPGTE